MQSIQFWLPPNEPPDLVVALAVSTRERHPIAIIHNTVRMLGNRLRKTPEATSADEIGQHQPSAGRQVLVAAVE
ncbi:hypothetical protein [Gemmata sp.]|uniref:hypothetical protein n=1 Tax=Gemmata sp. TaxID=1914242 RepID=UPI003F6E905D